MITAFHSVSGRADATHAAFLLATAYAFLAEPVTVVRVIGQGGILLPEAPTRAEVMVIETVAATPQDLADLIRSQVEARPAHNLVLDLPLRCLMDRTIRGLVDLPVVTVGPTDLDERMAVHALANAAQLPNDGVQASNGERPAPPWLLRCRRGGGSMAAEKLKHAVRELGAVGRSARILPTAVPAPSRDEAVRILGCPASGRMIDTSLTLLAVIGAAFSDVHAVEIEAGTLKHSLERLLPYGRIPDERRAGERLHELADELQGLRDGILPRPGDLENAPILNDWQAAVRSVQVLKGHVYEHPDMADGRQVTTSELFASDGATWARTMSRWYRLRTPAKRGTQKAEGQSVGSSR